MAKDPAKSRPPAPDVPGNPELLPTPEVGDVVWYFPKGDPKATPSAALVTKVEMVGRIECIAFPPRSIGEPHMNVWYVELPEAIRKQQWRQLNDYGGWGFKGGRVPKHAYERHQNQLQQEAEAREAAAEKAERRAKEKEAEELATAGA
jgi:hypothetical protein